MSEFQPIGLQHKPFIDEALAWEGSKSSSDSFGNVFLWDILCRRNVAVLGERLGIEHLCSKVVAVGVRLRGTEILRGENTVEERVEIRNLCPYRIYLLFV